MSTKTKTTFWMIAACMIWFVAGAIMGVDAYSIVQREYQIREFDRLVAARDAGGDWLWLTYEGPEWTAYVVDGHVLEDRWIRTVDFRDYNRRVGVEVSQIGIRHRP